MFTKFLCHLNIEALKQAKTRAMLLSSAKNGIPSFFFKLFSSGPEKG
jgi:hypothetical protein